MVVQKAFRLMVSIIHFFVRDPRLLFKYIAVGGTAATLEFLLFNLFYSGLHLPLLLANCAAIAICIVFSFTLQKRWTFRNPHSVRKQLPPYVFMISVAVVLNNLLLYLFVAQWNIHPALAKLLQIGLVFGWNFSFSKLMVFKH